MTILLPTAVSNPRLVSTFVIALVGRQDERARPVRLPDVGSNLAAFVGDAVDGVERCGSRAEDKEDLRLKFVRLLVSRERTSEDRR
jgi:hypothetical protein